MPNDLVSYSRAGDVFHYRWAARRCLRLIHPNSTLQKIVIEGSAEVGKAGEYVIDATEYTELKNNEKKIDYYQLKHTTVLKNQPFILSDLKDTIIGFAKRFVQHKENNAFDVSNISFSVITNRKIDESFKQELGAIVRKDIVNKRFKKTIEGYTKLNGDNLVQFCNLLRLEDVEGDYDDQRHELSIELAQLMAGHIDNIQINNLVALVQDKVLPSSDGQINRDDVLKRFGITSERQLYPAPAVWDDLENIIEREQHNILKESISNSFFPVIVHAAGGVGKSVFCRQLINSLSDGSFGIAYDCFGAGNYRGSSTRRHRHRDALVQIVNELSSKGLCDPLIVQDTTLDGDIMQKFLLRISNAVKSLQKTNDSSKLFILIDAADNAEMAAKEFNESCFAHELLREKIPENCSIVLLCRTERVHLFQPQSFIPKLELKPFSKEETLLSIRKWFPDANEKDGMEFHRLTSGNPRVQANALYVKHDSVNKLLNSLGPLGTTVEKQIEFQLNAAILKIKDFLPVEFQNYVNAICLGLASLPPHIPIEVLSKSSDVGIENIKSFVSDIGRSLWLSDSSVQFRDEPTETWFRDTFLATKENYENYIKILEPLGYSSTYVAEVLPHLYLKAGQYIKLIDLALTDNYLPENNPIDARNVRVSRLQFAFKASLKLGNYKDAIKLSMRAGEEVAGNQRQLTLFKTNIDLLTSLQSKDKVQEIAFKRLLIGQWDGSENVYSASLLSGIKDYHGEARGYLRAAMNWLTIYFEELKENDDFNNRIEVNERDILELTFALFNLSGISESFNFLNRFTSKEWVFVIVQNFARRLIDLGKFEELYGFLKCCKREPYFTVAIISELIQVGKFAEKSETEKCLNLLYSVKSRIEKPNHTFEDRITPAIISFLEGCLYHNLLSKKILEVLNYYVYSKASRMVFDSHFSYERNIFIRSLAIRAVLSGKEKLNIDEISAKEFIQNKKEYESNNDIRKFTEVINGLFPWFLLRAQILSSNDINLIDVVDRINETSKKARANRYGDYDTLPNEIAEICASILVLYNRGSKEEINLFYEKFLQNDNSFKITDRLNLLRAVYRSSHLLSIREQLELSTYELIKNRTEDGPEEIAESYISLARAVLILSDFDASAYFDEAIQIASKFGDELVQRWESIVVLAMQACSTKSVSDELAYRFIRCTELIGENVSREKHWNRSEAMQICTRMSSGIGISALSRWRDREVGRFEYQFENVLHELTESKVISASVGWALTRFFSNHALNEYLSICLENESSIFIRKKILDDAVYMLQLEGTNEKYWEKMKIVATKFNVNNEQLDGIVNFYLKGENASTKASVKNSVDKLLDGSDEKEWGNIFDGLCIYKFDDFSVLIERFKSAQRINEYSRNIRSLLKEALNRIEERFLLDLIDVVLLSDSINYYDAENLICSIAQKWKNRISFNRKLLQIIYKFGERFSYNLTNEYSFDSFVKDLNADEHLIKKLKEGIFIGLANVYEFANANIFFGFVNLASSFVNADEACDLVDYSLSRFELHIENDFGDGVWSDWLGVSNNINKNIAGFIWSALGSPQSRERWNAAHCVRKLAELKCTDILDALVEWLEHDKVDAFGSNKFPFYNLHARQYLMLAFARVSLEQPEILHKYSNILAYYALSGEHILIQKFASEIALNIEGCYQGTYEGDLITTINNVGKSKIASIKEGYNYTTTSYWHINGKIDTSLNYNFGWDFDRYWFELLGSIFGLPLKQIEDLAANIIIKDWEIINTRGYNSDPRVILWNRSSHERGTWHDHGSYPRTDNLDFYLSYHSMLVVAAKLIEKMPLISRRDSYEDGLEEWISRHALTQKDGKWLSDCRDPLPLKRPSWIGEERKNNWQSSIVEEDFLNCLKDNDSKNFWINVKGGWSEKKDERTETFTISSALVSRCSSDALLKALATCDDPYDYKLPYFGEDDMEIDSDMFTLKGWINERSSSKGVDEFDPYADHVDYPPYSLGNMIEEKLGLIVSEDNKFWQIAGSNEIALICETWSSYRESKDEEPNQSGMRLNANLPFLKQLCKILDCDMIFDVGINREISTRYSSEKREYSKPKHKIFILSADGKLRTTDTDYQLG